MACSIYCNQSKMFLQNVKDLFKTQGDSHLYVFLERSKTVKSVRVSPRASYQKSCDVRSGKTNAILKIVVQNI